MRKLKHREEYNRHTIRLWINGCDVFWENVISFHKTEILLPLALPEHDQMEFHPYDMCYKMKACGILCSSYSVVFFLLGIDLMLLSFFSHV